MKARLLVLALVFVLAVGALPALAQDGRSLVWERFDVTIDEFDMAANRFRVTESYLINVDRGPFRFGTAEIPLDRLEEIEWISIVEDGKPLSEACTGESGTYCVTNDGNTISVQYYFVSPAETRTTKQIELVYMVYGALRSYESGDQLYWVAIPEDLPFPVLDAGVVVELPADAPPEIIHSYPDNWPYEVVGNTIKWEASGGMTRGDFFEVRVQYSHNEAMAKPSWQQGYDLLRANEEGQGSMLAQDGGTHTVTFNGFGITWNDALANGANVTQYEGEPLDFEAPGGPQPPRIEIVLARQIPWNEVPVEEQGVPGSDRQHIGAVYVYNVADVADYEWSQEQVDALQTLLAERPDLSEYMHTDVEQMTLELPFLPVFPAAQVLRARAEYVETDALQGIRYVTVYRHDVAPFIASEFYYTFQGLTADGTHYVSMVFPITIDVFPAEFPDDLDYEAFVEGLDTYFAESIAQINEAQAESFTPRLEQFDTVIESFFALETAA